MHGRQNNIGLLRFAAALAVLLFHCYALNGVGSRDPVGRFLPGYELGGLGVGAFFFLSGLLVTESYVRRDSLREFALARALRIYPGLVVAVLLGVALAAVSSTAPLGLFLSGNDVRDYLLKAPLGLAVLDRVGSAYSANPFPFALNGSLWTLPIELRLYWFVAGFGVLSLLRRRRTFSLVVALIFALVCVRTDWLPLSPNVPGIWRLGVLFALGSLASTWKDRLPLSIPAAAMALLVSVLAAPVRNALMGYCCILGYAVLVAAYHPALRLPDMFRGHDYSYGLYIYAFPLQQTLIERGGALAHRPSLLFMVALPATLAVAMLSWHWLEKPALQLKRSWGSRRALDCRIAKP